MQFINTWGTSIQPTEYSPTDFPFRIKYISTFYGHIYIEYYPQDYDTNYYNNKPSKIKNIVGKAPPKNKPYYRRGRW